MKGVGETTWPTGRMNVRSGMDRMWGDENRGSRAPTRAKDRTQHQRNEEWPSQRKTWDMEGYVRANEVVERPT